MLPLRLTDSQADMLLDRADSTTDKDLADYLNSIPEVKERRIVRRGQMLEIISLRMRAIGKHEIPFIPRRAA